mgnify:CR=1 FL=1
MEQLWQMLTLRPDGEEGGELLLTAPDQGQPADRVFGGLLLAQAVAAAGHDLPAGVVPLALNADFLSGVPVTGSNTWRVRALGGGRRMATRRVSLLDEHGDVGFTATVRLGEVRADLPSYRTVTPRQVPGPDGLVPLAERYGEAVDRESAHELLAQRMQAAPAPEEAPPPAPKDERPKEEQPQQGRSKGEQPKAPQEEPGMVEQVVQSSAFRSALRSAGTVIGREITRSLFGTARRRRR